MNNKKKIYITLVILSIIILVTGIILNFKTNKKETNKITTTAKYSKNDAIVELNKIYDFKGYTLNFITETNEEYVFQVVIKNETNTYKFNKNTAEIKVSTTFG